MVYHQLIGSALAFSRGAMAYGRAQCTYTCRLRFALGVIFVSPFTLLCRELNIECAVQTRAEFEACSTTLTKQCSATEYNLDRFVQCASAVSESRINQCGFSTWLPELEGNVMAFNPETWTENHGDDHFLSFCAISLNQARKGALHVMVRILAEWPYRSVTMPRSASRQFTK